MFTKLLLNESQLDEDRVQLAKHVIDGLARMSALLDGLHAFAIGATGQSEPVDLQHVAVAVLHDLEYSISTSGSIVTVHPLPLVQGNETQLWRVLQNLVVNAIKYRGEAPAEICISAEREGPLWVIKVKDTGIGIDRKHHEDVFSLLRRLHGPEIPGAGLGLAICKNIVEAHGGAIWVESELGSGSTFCFTVAAAQVETAGSSLPASGKFMNGTAVKAPPRIIAVI
jgi:light-regulated signal transduction histidine kinase (bacteriophytochrome)